MNNMTDKRNNSRVELSRGHKTPYEIRTELLELAYRILRDRAVDNGALGTITTDEVIAEATKLNRFISQG